MTLTRMDHHTHNTHLTMRGAMLRGQSFDSLEQPWHVGGSMSHLCFGDSGGTGEGGNGGGGGKEEKQFSQEDLDRLIAKRLAGKEKEIAALTKQAEDAKGAMEQLSSKLEALEQKASGNQAGATQKEVETLTKQVKRLEDQLKGAETEKANAIAMGEKAMGMMQSFRVSSLVKDALLVNKAHAHGLADAVETMMRTCNPEFDMEKGELTLTVNGVPFTKPEEAAARFLEQKPFFAQGIAGGAGGNRPNGSGGLNAEQMKDMGGQDLLLAGLKPPKG